ncbi:Protein RALF-like 33 [Camellia lanceoleosa]|uniref:Protein RALF-like 33 n=1 Tax=Camellia lanceoleosa TaxID=1840588 RepID=A0ACC0J0R1_9ERIC|nr:Protein RALF-like 33 [Camellia lanceoleosa]
MDHEHQLVVGWWVTRLGCRGTIAESFFANKEFRLDYKVNRRILASSYYINYGTLERNSVPYSRRGASYYNCQFGAQAMATIDDRVMGVTVGGRGRETHTMATRPEVVYI